VTVLLADSIAKSFGERRVLSAASLRATSGEVRALLGRNGVGKSTLLRIAAGLDSPDGGMIAWRERRFERTDYPTMAREGLLVLPGDGLLSPAGTVRRQLELFARTFPGGPSVNVVLERMRLTEHADSLFQTLSGGERRRAEIAAALVRAPTCLFADEVFRDLAPVDADFVGGVLREMAAGGCAIVITGHELAFVLEYADHVTWCTSGTTYEIGPPAVAREHDALRRGLLGIS
jgi:ABC-type multidrug transport system ATPase subunit